MQGGVLSVLHIRHFHVARFSNQLTNYTRLPLWQSGKCIPSGKRLDMGSNPIVGAGSFSENWCLLRLRSRSSLSKIAFMQFSHTYTPYIS